MGKQIIPAVLLAIFAFIYQFPFLNNTDLDNNRIAMLSVAGLIAIIATKIFVGFKKPHALAFVPIAYVIWAACVFNVQKYSFFHLPYYVGLVGVVLWASNCKEKHVAYVLVGIAAIQVVANYGFKVPWSLSFSADEYIFGTVRHHLRYGAILMVGAIAAGSVVAASKNPISSVLFLIAMVAFSALTIKSGARGPSFALIFVGCACSYLIFGARGFVPVAILAAVGCALLYNVSGLSGREEIWTSAIQAIMESKFLALFGHGVDSWTTTVSNRHPHNEILHIVYEYGIVGMAIFAACLGILVFGSKGWPRVGLIALSLTFLTNSGRYPVIFLCWGILAGQTLRKYEHKKVLRAFRCFFRLPDAGKLCRRAIC